MITFIVNWLAQPDNGGPRLLDFCGEDDFSKEIIRAIREVIYCLTICLFSDEKYFLAIPCRKNSAHIFIESLQL